MAIAQTRAHISMVRKATLPLFLASGAAGLVYEVTWTRSFGVVFGNTVFAVSTVLTAFMLGLALGSWFFGRIADASRRPLALYALLEAAVGVYALVFPQILKLTDVAYSWFFRSFGAGFYALSLFRFALSILILLVPTMLMGGTLPVLSRLWAGSAGKGPSDSQVGRSVGLLYAINTFGAVGGSFLAGYVFIKALGVNNTIYLAALANLVVGLLAFVLSLYLRLGKSRDRGGAASRRSRRAGGKKHKRPQRQAAPAAAAPAEPEGRQGPSRKRLIVLAAVGVSGFCSLGLEVLWTRVLIFVLGTSAYAFACMLTTFIFGLAVGSFLCSRLLLPRIRRPILAMAVVAFLVAVSAVASVRVLGMLWQIDYLMTRSLPVSEFWKATAIHFVDASVVLLLPTVLMGFVFPIAIEACVRGWGAVGRGVGEVYAGNTLGCVVGSFAAGFVAVPLLGLRNSFLLIITIQAFLAVVLLFFSERRGPAVRVPAVVLAAFMGIAGLLLLPRDVFLQTINTYHYPSRIVYMKDDATGTVTVHDLPDGDRLIAVDGVNVAGMDLMLRTTQKLQGYVPLLVHGSARKVIQIGFGSGETSGVGLAFGVEDYRIVDVCPGVFEAGRFFEEINRGSYKDPRLTKIIMDGKNFAKLTDEKFDIIMNDSTYPGTTGSSALYTYDHFLQCRRRLAAGGVLSCWLPLDLRAEDFRLILRSFRAAMPNCSLWMANNCLNKHAVLVGTIGEMRIDFQRASKLFERPDIAADLELINIHSVYDLLDCFVIDQHGMRNIGGDGPLNTDDRPSLEFGAAIKRDEDGCLMVVLSGLLENHCPISRYVVNLGATAAESQEVSRTLEQYFKGTGHALRALLGILQGDPEIMNNGFEMALKANPLDRDVQSCLDEIKTELTALVRAVERTPHSPDLQSRLAKRYLLLRDYERAAERFRAYVGLVPGSAAAWNNLGICYKELDRLERAVPAFERAIECDRTLLLAHFNLALTNIQLGDLSQAVGNIDKALPLSPAPYKVLLYDKLAQVHLMQKRYDAALTAVEEALKLAPRDSAVYGELERRRETVLSAAAGTGP